MRIKTVALSLIVGFAAVGGAPFVSAQKLKVISLAVEGGSVVTTIHVDDQYLLAESEGNSESFLVRDDAVFTINRKDKTYRVMTYRDLLAHLRQKAGEFTASPQNPAAASGVDFKLTDETAIISGIRVRKLVKTNNGQLEAELWVSSELMPAKLRVIGDNLRSSLPKDYWYRMNGNPGMIELVMLYGIPLKMVLKDHQTVVAKVVPGSSTDFSFEVPAGYKKLDN